MVPVPSLDLGVVADAVGDGVGAGDGADDSVLIESLLSLERVLKPGLLSLLRVTRKVGLRLSIEAMETLTTVLVCE